MYMCLSRFFGIKAHKVPDGIDYPIMIITPLYPALIAGFLANWWLVDRYGLQCDSQHNGDCAVIHDGICCTVENSTLSVTTMMGVLGGNISLGYAVIRFVVVSLLANRGNVTKDADLEKN